MTTFEMVMFTIGCLVGTIIGACLLTILLYAMSAVIVFIILGVKLNTKCTSEVIVQTLASLDKECDHTNRRANTGWPAQYIKYVVGNYFQIVWGNGWVGKVFNRLAKAKYSSGNNDRPNNVSYFTPIPLNDKPLNGIHADNLPQEKPEVNQNGTLPVSILRFLAGNEHKAGSICLAQSP